MMVLIGSSFAVFDFVFLSFSSPIWVSLKVKLVARGCPCLTFYSTDLDNSTSLS